MIGTLLQGGFEPHHVFTLLAGDECIEIAVALHINEADVVGGLVITDDNQDFGFVVIHAESKSPFRG